MVGKLKSFNQMQNVRANFTICLLPAAVNWFLCCWPNVEPFEVYVLPCLLLLSLMNEGQFICWLYAGLVFAFGFAWPAPDGLKPKFRPNKKQKYEIICLATNLHGLVM